MQTEQLVTEVVWKTEGVDRGLKNIVRAGERMAAVEKDSVTLTQAIEAEKQKIRNATFKRNVSEATASSDKLVAATKGMYAEMEKADKEYTAKLQRETKARYAAMDKDAQFRSAALARSLGSATAGQRMNTSGGGAHASGGILGSGRARMIGDGLDMLTGHQGWVMRMNQAQQLGHMLPGLAGSLGGGGAMMTGGVAAGAVLTGLVAHQSLKRDQESDALREAAGITGVSALYRNGFTGGIARRINPAYAPERNSFGRADSASEGGMQEQAEGLKSALKEFQEKNTSVTRAAWRVATGDLGGAGAAQRDSLRAQEKLDQIDSHRAELVKERATVAHKVAFGGAYASGVAENALALKENNASSYDRMKKGEIDRRQYFAEISAHRAESDIRLRDLGIDKRTRARGVATTDRETEVRGLGMDVAMENARGRYQQAAGAAKDARNPEEKSQLDAEAQARWQDFADAEKATRERKANLKIEQEIADFRGGAEARSLNAAEKNLERERELLSIAKERGADAEREAKVRVSMAELSLSLEKQAAAERRIGNQAAIRTGNVGVARAGARLKMDLYSQDDNARFAAGQAQDRGEAVDAVTNAQTGVTAAKARINAAKDAGLQPSEDALREETLAQQKLTAAVLARLDTEKRLTQEARVRARTLQAELDATRNVTAAMRLRNSGRSDLANVAQTRAQSAARVLQLHREGRPEMAREEQEQQRQREIGMFDEKYLRPDGRRRRRSEINREERHLRQISRRFNRAHARLERDGGLINVHRDMSGRVTDGLDPLTRQPTSKEDLYERMTKPAKQAAAEKNEDAKTIADLWTLLSNRLPEVTA